MKTLKYLKIIVSEPFSGGKLLLKDIDSKTQLYPEINLAPVKEPSYEGIPKAVADYDRVHRLKDGYILSFFPDDLPFITFKRALIWEIKGSPCENVTVEMEVDDLGVGATALCSGLYLFGKKLPRE